MSVSSTGTVSGCSLEHTGHTGCTSITRYGVSRGESKSRSDSTVTEYRQWSTEQGRWIYPDEPDYQRDPAFVNAAIVEQRRLELRELRPVGGQWPNPASLSRFGYTKMPPKMFKRFMAKIQVRKLDQPTACWLWTGGTHDKGYGRFYLGKDPDTGSKIWAYSHRISFEHFIGFPPDGYIVDHRCNHKLCCNPEHLWPETNNDNLRLADARRPWKRRNQFSQE